MPLTWSGDLGDGINKLWVFIRGPRNCCKIMACELDIGLRVLPWLGMGLQCPGCSAEAPGYAANV
jgi:hypothetical protein